MSEEASSSSSVLSAAAVEPAANSSSHPRSDDGAAAEDTKRIRVVFLHGLEGGPGGLKPTFLSRFFAVTTPQLNSRNPFGCVLTAIRTIHEVRPHVVVGSSFGAGILQWLLQRGEWRGPSLLLAPALSLALPFSKWLPHSAHAIICHGLRDETVPIESSRSLVVSAANATTTTPLLSAASPATLRVELLEVDDAHRLDCLLDDTVPGLNLRDLVLRLHRESSSPDFPSQYFDIESKGFVAVTLLGLQLAWQLPVVGCMILYRKATGQQQQHQHQQMNHGAAPQTREFELH